MELVSGELTHMFTSNEAVFCICITSTDYIIVGTDKRLSKYTTQGKVVLSSRVTETGDPVVYSPIRITECPVTHNVAVVDPRLKCYGGDDNKCIVAMERNNFKKLFTYTGEIPSKQTQQSGDCPFNPCCVSYDSKGNLVIGNYENRKVLLLYQSGEFLRIIHTASTKKPTSLCLDRRGQLCVAFGQNVKLLQYTSMYR
ncbi:uncharacterized protein [Argopecten irradians]|uniref:uncharacterized protein n=1 Tax=Argopecten irradians TaxID=31199 RepID=UPI0037197401